MTEREPERKWRKMIVISMEHDSMNQSDEQQFRAVKSHYIDSAAYLSFSSSSKNHKNTHKYTEP